MLNYFEKVNTCPTGSFPYIIKSGDTLYKLAITYNTTVDAIMKINPGINPNRLQIGQKICIPDENTSPIKCPVGSFAYTIKRGDTLYHLAITYNTTVEAIIRLNPGINPGNLQIGEVICIPRETPPQKCPVGSFAYTIKRGDTLYNLAITYNTTVGDIMRLNPGIDPDNLQIGQVICIPRTTPPPQKCPVGSFSYTIKPGDTLYNLAITYNTTVEAIMRLNPGIDPNNLQIGQMICIPRTTPPPPPCDGFMYVVRPGDTIFKLSMIFNLSVQSIIDANPGIDPGNLQVGQLICIPKSGPMPCPGGTIYVIRENDSLTSILLRFNISIMDLMAGNPGIDIKKLVVGQELCILPHKDRGCPCPPGSKPYIILPSDESHNTPVVVNLAGKFNVSVSSIMLANQNLAPGDFKAGNRVCIPNK